MYSDLTDRLGGIALIRNSLYPGHAVSWTFQAPANEGIIWSFWHNRLFLMSYVHRRFFSQRPPGAAMTSQSKDGEWAAQLVLRMGIAPVTCL